MLNQSKSAALTTKFNEYFPGGHSNFRCRLDAGTTKLFVTKAEGSRIWDVDGNEYIEYNGAMGPLLLGHRHPEYIKSLKDYLDMEATVYGTNLLYSENDLELAELLIKHIPCAEEVKFCTSGTEAVQLLFRVARAYTGKKRILRFAEMYHGWLDNVLDNVARDTINISEVPLAANTPEDSVMYSIGKSPWSREESIVLNYNDCRAVDDVVEAFHNEIALIFVEPMASDAYCMHPAKGFLERVRELCDQYNIVMGFDEVITGFRLGLGGAQEYLGIIPDICSLGKAISGGIPFSAIVGKKKIMDIFRTEAVLGAGTYNGYGLGVKACITAIKLYEKNDGEISRNIRKVQDKLIDGMLEIAVRNNVPLTITEAPGVFYTIFGIKGGRIKPTDLSIVSKLDRKWFDQFRYNLMHEGVVIMANCRWFIGGAHTIDDAERTLGAFENAIKKTIAELSWELQFVNQAVK